MLEDLDYCPSQTEIDAILVFLPLFEMKDFIPAVFKTEPGHLPCCIFSDELDHFHSALYDNGFVSSFNWRVWQEEAKCYLDQPELLQSADLQIIRKLITLHVRKERFCEGHLPSMVENGHIVALLQRLKELRDTS